MEPRVLTPDELKALPRLAIVFIECFDGEYNEPIDFMMAGMKTYDDAIVDEDGTFYGPNFENDMGRSSFDGSMFRFWNMKPTEDQRKAVPWNG